uniref:C2H2-type domain-containing protein n=1 Tax=Haemonchus placei TaxID=6290 RepID=A0A158QMS2_HAEPC
LKYLESHHILALEKNFPDAIYWCSLCDFHMSNIQHVRTHFDTHQHFPEEQVLLNGRGPLWEQHMEVSKNISDLLSRHVFEKLGLSMCLVLGVYLDDQVFLIIGASDVQFSTEVPMSIKLTVSGVRVRISWRCENGLKYGKLLSVYTAIRPQFASLCRVVRKWAEVSGIYSVDRRQGGLTSYGFDLMVLYFLLQKNLLPCLHEGLAYGSPTVAQNRKFLPLPSTLVAFQLKKIGVLEKPWDLAELYVEFLCFYASRIHQNEIVQVYTAKQVSKDRSRWNKKLLQISDPFRTDNVVTFTKAYQVYFFNCFLKSFLYFAIPQTINGPLLDVTLYQKVGLTVARDACKMTKIIVRQIAQHLQQMAEVDNVYAITGAKVPIVKFNWTRLGVEGDISYYNVLALSNTEMLKQYCSWDCRVAPLGVWIKRWAKSCDIGDASRGSLSSYAFIILLLHYLQNCDPPVLPRLQEDFRDDSIQPVVVDNCDVYFHREVIPDWSQNRQSVGELFVGFLDYYARFDFGTQVVQIRRKKPLLKMEKDWNRSLCIEDPFDLCHNLGSGVSRKMFVFIVRNIHNSRKLFMLSDVRRAFLEGRKVVLLRKCQMGPAPTDRQCRICHRIGHFAEACQK